VTKKSTNNLKVFNSVKEGYHGAQKRISRVISEHFYRVLDVISHNAETFLLEKKYFKEKQRRT